MKKFLFFATVVSAAFTSCVSDNEEVLESKENLQPITFEVAKYKPSSRSNDTGNAQSTGAEYTAFPTNQLFGTFAYKADAINGAHSLFMNNEKVGYVNNVWIALGDTYFWPQVGHVDFISYYPHSTAPGGILPTIGSVNDGDYNKLSFENYQVSQVDLMYADKAHLMTHNYKTYDHSGVPTLFRHALARLSFEVKTKYVVSEETMSGSSQAQRTQWQVLVHSITLNDLYDTGSIHLQTSSPATIGTTQWSIVGYQDGNPKVWTPTGGSMVSKAWEVEGGQSLNTTATPFADATGYYVLPQTFTNELQSVTIKYSITNKLEGSPNFDTPTEFTK